MAEKKTAAPFLFFGLTASQSLVLALCTIFTMVIVPRDFTIANLPGNVFVALIVWSLLLACCLRSNAKSHSC